MEKNRIVVEIGTEEPDHLIDVGEGDFEALQGRKTNLASTWIDYQKAYALVPHSWMLETHGWWKPQSKSENFEAVYGKVNHKPDI